jgi:hypothetical protein
MNAAPTSSKELSSLGAESGLSLKSLRVESLIQMPQPNQQRSSKPQESNSTERHRFFRAANDSSKEKSQGRHQPDFSHDTLKVPIEKMKSLQSAQQRAAIKSNARKNN